MRCIEERPWRQLALIGAALALAACGNRQPPVASPPPAATAARAHSADAVPALPRATAPLSLPAPATPRSLRDLQLQVARRLVAAHPESSYTERAPDRLHAIPVLEIELHADGSVRRIDVLRRPTTGDEATALAIAAVRRAAPFGNVSRLPKPWKVVETFLFDDTMRFKPRTLDID